MRLESKIQLIVLSVLVSFFSLNLCFFKLYLSPKFEKLEREYASETLQNGLDLLTAEIDHLELLTIDWAQWDDTYEFITDLNSDYLASNLNVSSLDNAGIDMLCFINMDRQIVWHRVHDPLKASILGRNQETLDDLTGYLFTHSENHGAMKGLVNTKAGLLAIGVSPILTSEQTGPSRGYLVMGRFLEGQILKNIYKHTKNDIQIIPLKDFKQTKEYTQVKNLLGGTDSFVVTLGAETNITYGLLQNLINHNLIVVRGVTTNKISHIGKAATRMALASTIVLGGVVFFVLFVFLHQIVTKPLSSFIEHLKKLTEKTNLFERVAETNSCTEIQSLEHEFNRMLERLEANNLKRQIAENKTLEVQKEWEITFDTLPDMVAVFDREDRILRINKAITRTFNISPEDAVGKACHELFHDTEAFPNMCPFKHFHATDSGDTQEHFIEINGDDYVVSMTPYYNATGEYIGVIHVLRNVTELKKTEKDLRDSQQLLKIVLDSIPIRIYWKDKESTLIGCNKQFALDAGFSHSCQVIGKTDFDMPWKTNAELYQQFDKKLIASGLPIYNLEESLTLKDGSYRIINTSKIPLRNSSGDITGILGVYEDITERKTAEDKLRRAKQEAEYSKTEAEKGNIQLKRALKRASTLTQKAREADKAKSEFLANMSHEIRTPMNGIIGFCNLLSKQKLTDKQRGFVETISTCGNNLLELIDNILDFSKIEAGKLHVEMINCSFERVLFDIEKLMQTIAAKKDIDFRVNKAADLPDTITTDPLRLQQCLINLSNNAIKFTEQGYVYINVGLETHDDKQFLRFDVEDTGIGIAPDRLGSIFEKFTQADGSTTRKYGGTGLGLSITKHLTELMGGTTSVTSTEGKGSVFTICLPVIEKPTAPLDETKTIPSATSPAPEQDRTEASDETDGGFDNVLFCGTALVVDDNEQNRTLMKHTLESIGLTVTLAQSGKQAIQITTKERFDLIFMDIQMPEMNGYQTTFALREYGVKIPIVAVTANILKDTRDKCNKAGFAHYLTKPIRMNELTEIIHIYPEMKKSGYSQKQ